VRRALARLASEGTIVRRRGSGTFARDKARRAARSRQTTAPILDDLRKLASCTATQLLAFETTPTPDFVQRDWPEFGATALVIRRIRHLNGAPVVLETTYIPEDIGVQLAPGKLGNDAALAALEKLGVRGTSAEQETAAIAADPVAARHLALGVGAPLLNVRRLVRDSQERIIEYSNFLYRPDRYEMHMRIDRTNTQRSRATRRKRA
jgi:GntR family transcriptional regulator